MDIYGQKFDTFISVPTKHRLKWDKTDSVLSIVLSIMNRWTQNIHIALSI